MTISMAICVTILAVAAMCNTYQIHRLEKKLEGKADKKKPRLRGRFVPARQVSFGESFPCRCTVCDTPVALKGHTVKQCEEAQKQDTPTSLPTVTDKLKGETS